MKTNFNKSRSLDILLCSIWDLFTLEWLSLFNGASKRPRPISAITREILANTHPSLIPSTSIPDSVRWTPRGNWMLSVKMLGKLWGKCIQLILGLSLCGLPLWVVSRLSTKDRLLRWGLGVVVMWSFFFFGLRMLSDCVELAYLNKIDRACFGLSREIEKCIQMQSPVPNRIYKLSWQLPFTGFGARGTVNSYKGDRIVVCSYA